MVTIYADVIGEQIRLTSSPTLASGTVQSVQMAFNFDDAWEGYGKIALFWGQDDEVYTAQVTNGVAVIPHEALTNKGTLEFGVYGTNDSKRIVTAKTKYVISDGAYTSVASESVVPSPSLLDQVETALGTMESYAEQTSAVAAAAEATARNGEYAFEPEIDWEQGGIDTTTGIDDDTLTTRTRCDYLETADYTRIVKTNSSMGVRIFYYNSEHVKQSLVYMAGNVGEQAIDHTWPYLRFDLSIKYENSPWTALAFYTRTELLTNVDALTAQVNVLANQSRYDGLALIMGDGCYLNYDTAQNTLTIPAGALLIGHNVDGNKPYKLLNSGTDTVITGVSQDALGTSAVKLVLNLSTWAFSVIAATAANGANEYLVAGIRLKTANATPSFTTKLPWAVDGVPYGLGPWLNS